MWDIHDPNYKTWGPIYVHGRFAINISLIAIWDRSIFTFPRPSISSFPYSYYPTIAAKMPPALEGQQMTQQVAGHFQWIEQSLLHHRAQVVGCGQRLQQALNRMDLQLAEARAGRDDAEAAHASCLELLQLEREAHTQTKASLQHEFQELAKMDAKAIAERQKAHNENSLKCAKIRFLVTEIETKDRLQKEMETTHAREKGEMQETILRMQRCTADERGTQRGPKRKRAEKSSKALQHHFVFYLIALIRLPPATIHAYPDLLHSFSLSFCLVVSFHVLKYVPEICHAGALNVGV